MVKCIPMQFGIHAPMRCIEVSIKNALAIAMQYGHPEIVNACHLHIVNMNADVIVLCST